MTELYSNKLSRKFRLLFWNVLGTIFSIIGLLLILLMINASEVESSLLVNMLPVILILIVIVGQWFAFYRYINNYSKVNRKSQLIVNIEANTIERRDKSQLRGEVRCITGITLFRHMDYEREYNSPKNLKENIVNILSDGPGRRKFRHQWYVQVSTEGNQRYYLTPLMLKLSDLPFKDVKLEFVSKPLITAGE